MGIVLVALILLLAGVDLWYLLLGGIALVALAAAFTALFFLVCVGMLLRSQRRMGEFTGFSEGGASTARNTRSGRRRTATCSRRNLSSGIGSTARGSP